MSAADKSIYLTAKHNIEIRSGLLLITVEITEVIANNRSHRFVAVDFIRLRGIFMLQNRCLRTVKFEVGKTRSLTSVFAIVAEPAIGEDIAIKAD